ncbi:MAG: PH domain-containing protein [Steroidobacteraceae bacterium]
MSRGLALITYIVLALAATLLVVGPKIVVAIVAVIFAAVWLWYRPGGFEVRDGCLVIRWPLRQRRIALETVVSATPVTKEELHARYGRGIRIGAGGLWGVFGLYRTPRQLFDIYVTNTYRLLVIERVDDRPLIISPADPHEMAQLLSTTRANAGS